MDHRLIFTNVVIRWPGSVHDARIFSQSAICRSMTQNHPDGYLLGDSGYGVKPFLLTPYLAPATLG